MAFTMQTSRVAAKMTFGGRKTAQGTKGGKRGGRNAPAVSVRARWRGRRALALAPRPAAAARSPGGGT